MQESREGRLQKVLGSQIQEPLKRDPASQILDTESIDDKGPVEHRATLSGIFKCKAERVEICRGEQEVGIREDRVGAAVSVFAMVVPYKIQGVPSSSNSRQF
jgi:hypothetical protein